MLTEQWVTKTQVTHYRPLFYLFKQPKTFKLAYLRPKHCFSISKGLVMSAMETMETMGVCFIGCHVCIQSILI